MPIIPKSRLRRTLQFSISALAQVRHPLCAWVMYRTFVKYKRASNNYGWYMVKELHETESAIMLHTMQKWAGWINLHQIK